MHQIRILTDVIWISKHITFLSAPAQGLGLGIPAAHPLRAGVLDAAALLARQALAADAAQAGQALFASECCPLLRIMSITWDTLDWIPPPVASSGSSCCASRLVPLIVLTRTKHCLGLVCAEPQLVTGTISLRRLCKSLHIVLVLSNLGSGICDRLAAAGAGGQGGLGAAGTHLRAGRRQHKKCGE